jgi:hypothetical protein
MRGDGVDPSSCRSEAPVSSTESRLSHRRRLAAVLAVVLLLAALRAIHLTADTPTSVGEGGFGVHVDEGYKSLAPRNLVVLGTTKADPLDEYSGWWRRSPITQSFHYVVFRLGAADLAHVRVLALVSTTLLLALVAWQLQAMGSLKLAIGATALLGISAPFFFYSRVSLFEIPLAVLLCGALFHAAQAGKRPLRGLVVLAAWTGVAVLGIKLSALVFFAPMGGVLALRWLLHERALGRRLGMPLLGLGLAAAFILWINADILIRRMDFELLGWATGAAIGPLARATPFLFAASVLIVLHFVVVLGRSLMDDSYLAMLIAVTVGAPLILAVFRYQPHRYYVPLFPMLVLLVAEWVRWRGWTRELPIERRGWILVTGIALGTWSMMTIAEGVNHSVLVRLPINLGRLPGLSERFLLVAGAPAALLAGFLWWRRSTQWSSTRALSFVVLCLLAIHAARSFVWVGAFLVQPTYQGVEMARMVREAVPAGSTIAGDWAPFAALGSDLRPIYMAYDQNRLRPDSELRPGYFLFSDTEAGVESLAWIESQPHISLLPAIGHARYAGRDVVLYPLRFEQAQD